jgi:hypothetical protein
VGVQPDRHDSDDEAWRAIVENYGERPQLDDLPQDPDDPPAGTRPVESSAPFGGRFGDLGDFSSMSEDPEDPENPFLAEEDHFEPPPPPPLPKVAPDRLIAWIGIFGSPAILLAALVFSISLPSWLGYLLVAGFVGGFVYLVYKMPRGPRDPWDDGAQL